jgi:hypothetical protein
MTARRRSTGARRWHVALAPCVPLLGLLFWNLDSTPPDVVWWPLVLVTTIVYAGWVVLARLRCEPNSVALLVTALTLTVMSHSMLVRAASQTAIPHLVPIAYGLALTIALLTLRIGPRAAWLTAFLNRALAIAVLLFCVQIAFSEWRRPRLGGDVPPLLPAVATDRPDVYVLILDGYGRADVLREHYGFENDLVPALRALGFFVADDAVANYPQTLHSLASSLNMAYLPDLLRGHDASALTRRSLGDLIARNRFFAGFAASGYHVRFYRSEYEIVRPAPAVEQRAPFGYMTAFGFSAFEGSAVPAVFGALGLPRGWLPLGAHRRQVLWTFDELAKGVEEDAQAPSLVFAHLLVPHPPFAFNPDGTQRRTSVPALLYDADHWQEIAKGTGERYERGYVDNVKFVNARVIDAVRRIVASARRPTIFYIQGDHGPAAHLKWDAPGAPDLRERFGILLAMKLPDDFLPPVADGVTPINAFRVIANRALGTALPPVPDRAYFANWSDPFDFRDVTEALSSEARIRTVRVSP